MAEPPLRYLATAEPRRLAPNALPTSTILERIDRAIAAGGEIVALGRLRRVFQDFPLEPAGARRERAAEGLREVERLKTLYAAPRTVYRPTPPDPGLDLLSKPAQYLKGVGPKRAELLGRHRIATVEDVLYHLPFRYEDRRSLVPLARLRPGEEATCVAEVVAVGEARVGRFRRRILEARVRDESGVLTLTWFNQIPYFASRVKLGSRLVVHGKMASGRRQIVHPEIEVLEGEEGELGRIVPIYEKPTEMSVGAMRKIVHTALEEVGERVPSVLPQTIAEQLRLTDLARAFRDLHQPGNEIAFAELAERRSLGHRSLVFDELFFFELGMLLRRHSRVAEPGIAFQPEGKLAQRLRAALPFRLTAAQGRVLDEIAADLARPHPMNRLLQGDVGSGKTIVAVLAALGVIECGHQVALMAPTEILAEQHHANVARWLEPLGIRPLLLTGTVQGRARKGIYAALAAGETPFAVGTHAVIQEGVEFQRLGLGIIDEQHRFGVLQRKALKGLGDNPDILLMTATPIPRTLSMTLYGDLDISALDELPPGRKPIETRVVRERDRERVFARVRADLDRGRQAYLVFPLIEESEVVDFRSAKRMAEELAAGALSGYRVGLLHGQMKSDEKDAVMRRFQAGDHQALVATTVIEVGIDVPNATVMVVDHAEQFGLAQLHQLRGRVGRGAEDSICFLISTGRAGPEGHERLKLLEREANGRVIAEADLKIRGPGEILGLRQSGVLEFRAANLVRDVETLEEARREADAWLARNPGLRSTDSAAIRRVLEHRWRGRLGLAQVG